MKKQVGVKYVCPVCGNAVTVFAEGEPWCHGSLDRTSTKWHRRRKMKKEG